MDDEWALATLREFAYLTEIVEKSNEYNVWDENRGAKEDIIASAQTVEKILAVVLPRWKIDIRPDLSDQWIQHREAAVRAIAEIESAAEVREHLGDTSPVTTAGAMHEWVWQAAKSLWQSGHYSEAVSAAIMKVNAELQNKVGRRDVGEASLFQQAFSADEPVSGKSRLRPRGDDDGLTARSLRRGIVSLAEGVFAALRNPASHDGAVDISEQVALERLATVSLLARWVDECEVKSVP